MRRVGRYAAVAAVAALLASAAGSAGAATGFTIGVGHIVFFEKSIACVVVEGQLADRGLPEGILCFRHTKGKPQLKAQVSYMDKRGAVSIVKASSAEAQALLRRAPRVRGLRTNVGGRANLKGTRVACSFPTLNFGAGVEHGALCFLYDGRGKLRVKKNTVFFTTTSVRLLSFTSPTRAKVVVTVPQP